MSGTPPSREPGLDALLRAVAAPGGDRTRIGDGNLDEFVETAVAALEGSLAAVIVDGGSLLGPRLHASLGLSESAAQALATAPPPIVADHDGSGFAGLSAAGADGDFPAALVAAGQREALRLPIWTRRRLAANLWVAAERPLAADRLARVAARACADRIGVALEIGHLHESLERAMAQILESDERMLGRIGLDIHDGPTQQLSVALLEVQLLEAELSDIESKGADLPGSLRPALQRIYETLGGALHEMRELIGHLRPAQFEGRRLPDILADAVAAFEARSGTEVINTIDGEFPVNAISVTQRITFYRILQETLTNAYRHGRASECRVILREEDGGISLEVIDNGSGFDVEHALRPRPGVPVARFGVHGMRDRTELLGGTCDIASVVGEGTRVRIFLPEWTHPGDDRPSDAG